MTEDLSGDWSHIDEVINRVRQVIDWLDDIIWNAMADPGKTVRRFRAEELKYQIETS